MNYVTGLINNELNKTNNDLSYIINNINEFVNQNNFKIERLKHISNLFGNNYIFSIIGNHPETKEKVLYNIFRHPVNGYIVRWITRNEFIGVPYLTNIESIDYFKNKKNWKTILK